MIDFIAVDWGTSSFRLWAMEATGQVVAARSSKEGMSTLQRPDFAPALEKHLECLSVSKDIPIVICGMAGAASGWQEAQYIPTPTRLCDIPAHAIKVSGTERDVRILPGGAQRDAARPDVMRGEETILLGAALESGGDGLFCLPGTHSKWARVVSGELVSFSTAMTGELFARLAQGSTLSQFVDSSIFDEDVFVQSVRDAANSPASFTHALFGMRAGPLLNVLAPETIASRLSGLLIGLELAGVGEDETGPVSLVSSGPLSRNYQLGLEELGFDFQVLDADELVRKGLTFAAQKLWPMPVYH